LYSLERMAGDIPKAERISICSKPLEGKTQMVLICHRPLVKRKEVNLLDPVQYSSVLEMIKEVADSVKVEWLPHNSVMGICFIFHIDMVQRESIPYKGMHHGMVGLFPSKKRIGRHSTKIHNILKSKAIPNSYGTMLLR
jgi:hypothetical protein